MAPTIGVCGFGRCGSSMLMNMLAAGGIEPCEGSAERSGELTGGDLFDLVPQLAARGALDGRSVKLLDYVGRAPLPTGPDWRFVWLDRDHRQQALSTLKFVATFFPDEIPTEKWELQRAAGRLIRSYQRDRPHRLGILRAAGPTVVLSYEQVLANPLRAVRHLRRIVPGIDGRAAADVVHQRTGACRPNLDVEMGRVA